MRVCALLLTVFMILSPCVVAIDMIDWQCYRYGVPGCTQVPGQLDFLAALTAPRRLAVAALCRCCWSDCSDAARKTLIRYEETPAPKAAPLPSGTTPPDPGRRPILCDPDLWSSKARTLRLHGCTCGATVATVCAFSGLTHVVNTTGGGNAFLLVTTVASCVLLAASCAVLTALSHPRDLEIHRPRARLHPNESQCASRARRMVHE